MQVSFKLFTFAFLKYSALLDMKQPNIASRTRRTIQNSKMSFILFLGQVFIGFFSRRIFLEYLGDEVLGLNTTLGNILNFLNLAELGIGIAISTSLYKPLHDNNRESICEIITTQRILYRRIAIFLAIVGALTMLTFPWFFPHVGCGLLYVYIAFTVFLSGSLTSYLWNYKEILFGADQKNFKLMPWIHGVRYAKIGLQLIFLLVVKWGIWGWIWWELVGNIATVFIINYVVRKEYPWLHVSDKAPKVLLKEHHSLIVKTKQLFIHKLAFFVLTETAPLIIYAFVSLEIVTHYANYMLLIGYTTTLMNVVFEGMGASIGNLVSEGNKEHTKEVFWELFTSRIWIAGIFTIGLYLLIEQTITIWIGPQYVLPRTTLLLMIIGMFIRMTRSIIESFKNAYQLFGDVWAPFAEAVINLGGSILFGYLWGLDGILLGSNLSLILIVAIWKPYYTFKKGLSIPVSLYFYKYALHLLIIVVCALMAMGLSSLIFSSDGFIPLLFGNVLALILFSFFSFVTFYMSTVGMRRFTVRLKSIIHKS